MGTSLLRGFIVLRRGLAPLAVLAALGAGGPVFSQESAPASAPAGVPLRAPERAPAPVDLRVAELLDQMHARYDQMKSVEGKFEQVRHSDTFMEDTR
ncbi:MAG: hypothetical protein NTW86_30585, partial [Candidatus Sumerlaeota bacterium]|nr:hypothetical protein [Candidatus Sumerlaeota bacterium]